MISKLKAYSVWRNVDLSTYVDKTFGTIEREPGPHGYSFYQPSPLPRELDLDQATVRLLSRADRSLGRLAGSGRLLPNPHLLVQTYITSEALASSRIEGTQASLSEVLEASEDEEVRHDVREVLNYIAAFEHGRRRLAELPLSLRLLREIHERLLRDVRGEEKSPGEFRTTQNWIGPPNCTLHDAVFVPPRQGQWLTTALTDWERYLNDDVSVPPLVAAALLHYQFETIHPFLDGNGRLGRLAIILHLMQIDELPQPLLYLSPYFARNRTAYYAHLQGVREQGAIQAWLQFFLEGVRVQADDAVDRAERLVDLQNRFRSELAGDRSRAGDVVDLLVSNPFITTARVMDALGVTNAGANNLLRRLEERGWLQQSRVAGRGGRITWVAHDVMAILDDTN